MGSLAGHHLKDEVYQQPAGGRQQCCHAHCGPLHFPGQCQGPGRVDWSDLTWPLQLPSRSATFLTKAVPKLCFAVAIRVRHPTLRLAGTLACPLLAKSAWGARAILVDFCHCLVLATFSAGLLAAKPALPAGCLLRNLGPAHLGCDSGHREPVQRTLP